MTISAAMAAAIALEAAIKIIVALRKANLVTEEQYEAAVKDAERRQDAVVDKIRDS
jgi:hypothetical protein